MQAMELLVLQSTKACLVGYQDVVSDPEREPMIVTSQLFKMIQDEVFEKKILTLGDA